MVCEVNVISFNFSYNVFSRQGHCFRDIYKKCQNQSFNTHPPIAHTRAERPHDPYKFFFVNSGSLKSPWNNQLVIKKNLEFFFFFRRQAKSFV